MDTSSIRVGVHVFPADPFWVQVREAVLRNLTQLGVTVVPLELADGDPGINPVDVESMAEEIHAYDLSVLISSDITDTAAYHVLNRGLPMVYLCETRLQHRLLTSLSGLYHLGCMAGELIATRLGGQGRVLCVGGLRDAGGDKGISRITGFYDVLSNYPGIAVVHCPAPWKYEDVYPVVEATLRSWDTAPDAIFGLSDSLALAARDAGRKLELVNEHTLVVGINGDPLALAAVAQGTMTATIETSPNDLGSQAAELAVQAARGASVPIYYFHHPRCVTAANVLDCSIQKLLEIADLPSQLVGFNRQQEQNRYLQLETSMAISQRVGALLDRSQLSHEIADLIRANYGYDAVRLFLWQEKERVFVPYGGTATLCGLIPLEQAGLLSEALQRREPVYIPDTRYTRRFPAEPDWADTRSRMVLPIRQGGNILGMLDLRSQQPMTHLRQDLDSLQALADQLGVAMRNAELYADAVQARESAETADRLKTRLLANVSHELRTPLNIIMGYSQAALSTPNPYGVELPESLRRDLEYVLQSGEHLYRMINDLLDLSRAEIGALDLVLEVVEPAPLLLQAFDSFVNSMPTHEGLTWRWEMPERLPLIHADPVRLRQIVLNLLSNANKFTAQGQIILGAEVEPPHLHLWVQDTGPGIPIDQQERIFEPFVTVDRVARRSEGVGLGLTITRRLVALHGGTMLLQSQPGQGSTFHVYLPLPDLIGETTATAPGRRSEPADAGKRAAVVWMSSQSEVPAEIKELAGRRQVDVYHLLPGGSIEALFDEVQPVALAWDMAAAAERQSTSREWSLIQRLRRHTICARLPFIVYGSAAAPGEAEPGAMTSVVLKPMQARALRDILDGMRPALACHPVWVVDDDPEALTLYQRLAADAFPEIETLAAADGAQALELLAQVKTPEQAPGLVLLDLMMPQVDGFQVLEALRAHLLTQRVPVVVLSGKMLTFEDVQRLDYAQVTFQPKFILSEDETRGVLEQALQSQATLSPPTSALARHALAYLQQNYAQPLSRTDIARAVGVTENYLTQIFRQEVGLTPWEFLSRQRIRKASELLRTSQASITHIAARVSFDDPAYFSRVFRKQMGVSPQKYRKSN